MTAKLPAALLLAAVALSVLPPPFPGSAPPSVLGPPTAAEPASHTAGFNDTSEYLLGRVEVRVFFLESNGSAEPQTENWTAQDLVDAEAEVRTGLDVWPALGPQALLNVTATFAVANVSVEPINGTCGGDGNGTWVCEEDLWVAEVMAQEGYATGDATYDARAYLNDVRAATGADWAFLLFVANSAADADGNFTAPPNGTAAFAHGWPGGPWALMTRDNGGAGLAGMDAVAARMTGFVFYATDEGDGISTPSGYLNVTDEDGSGCLMDTGNLGCLSNGTKGQVGWVDSDLDGLYDVVDVEPDTVLTAFPPALSNGVNLSFSGNVSLAALANENPIDPGADIQLAAIVNLGYQRDGAGPWVPVPAADGAWDGEAESFALNLTVTAPGSHTIAFCATSSYGVLETSCAQRAFEVDSEAPVTALQSPGTNLTNQSLVGFQASVADNHTVTQVQLYYSRDGGNWTLYTTRFLPPWLFAFDSGPIGDGTYRLHTVGTDEVGNVEAPPASPDVTLRIDTRPPVTSALGVSPWFTNDFAITLSPDEANTTTFFRLDNGSWLENTFVSITEEGLHVIEFYSIDEANNTEAVRNVTVGLDETPPSHTFAALPAYTNNATALLNWTAFDALSGVDHLELYQREAGGNWVFAGDVSASPHAVVLPNDGPWEFRGIAVDVAGKREADPGVAEVSTYLDTDAPNTTAPALPNYTGGLTFTVAATASDTVGIDRLELWYAAAGENLTLWNSTPADNASWAVAVAAEGAYEFEVRAFDLAGNADVATGLGTLVDATPPTVSTTAPTADWLTDADVALAWNASDALSGLATAEVRVDAGDWTAVAGASTALVGLLDGQHTAEVRVTDRAGHAALDSVTFGVDTTPPTLSITFPAANQTVSNATPLVRWTAADATSGLARFVVVLDEEPAADVGLNNSYRTPSLPEGRHTVVVRAYDAAGLVAERTVEFYVGGTTGGGGAGPFSILPWVFLLIVVAVLLLWLLMSRRRKKEPFEELEQMHKVEAEAEAEAPEKEAGKTEAAETPPAAKPPAEKPRRPPEDRF